MMSCAGGSFSLEATGSASTERVVSSTTWGGTGTNGSTSRQRRLPPKRASCLAPAFDPREVSRCLAGGEHSGSILGDTWAWDGALDPLDRANGANSKGGTRAHAAMAYDTEQGVLRMVGVKHHVEMA